MSLDVVTFYEKLESQYSLDAVRFRPDSTTTAIGMVAQDGSPLTVGWFQNAGKPGAPQGGMNCYALTSIPADARTIHHRVSLEQIDRQNPFALLKEENWHGYMEGYDDFPTTIDRRRIDQPVLGRLVRITANQALVLNAEQARAYAEVNQDLAIDGLRQHGLFLREQRAGLGFVEL